MKKKKEQVDFVSIRADDARWAIAALSFIISYRQDDRVTRMQNAALNRINKALEGEHG